MKEFIKNEKVLGLLRKAIQEKTITYEEINRELKDELPVDKNRIPYRRYDRPRYRYCKRRKI